MGTCNVQLAIHNNFSVDCYLGLQHREARLPPLNALATYGGYSVNTLRTVMVI